jgi:ABC-2 type transport system ATP-binding protein
MLILDMEKREQYNNEPVLTTEKLTKRYNQKLAVDHVFLSVNKGDIYGLVGRNGAGKTTLFRMICGLAAPTYGTITLFGQKGTKVSQRCLSRIGSAIEYPGFYPELDAKSNLEYFRILKGVVKKNAVNEILELVGLSDAGKKKFRDFSLGMKQRLAIGLALLGDPDLLILDEPINGLDPLGIVEVRELLLELNQKSITILISSHLLSELSLIATRYGFLKEGKLVREIDREELEQQSRKAFSIKTAETSRVLNVLEAMGFKDVQVVSLNEVRIYDHNIDSQEVIETLLKHKVKISQFSEVGENLEEYFVSLSQGEEI